MPLTLPLPTTVRRAAPLAAAALSLAAATPAAASVRYASASPGAATSGVCAPSTPCTLSAAIGGAVAGDEVIVGPGDYSVDTPLTVGAAIDLHGAFGQARPRLLGASSLLGAALTDKSGGSVRHLYVYSQASAQSAIELQGTVGDDLVLVGEGDAAKLVGVTGGTTVLRDSVARSVSGSRAVKLADGNGASGPVELRNVTAWAPSGTAIESQMSAGRATLVNVVARGGTYDLSAGKTGTNITASYSSWRPSASPGATDGGHNSAAEPLFADPAHGDFHPLARTRGTFAVAASRRRPKVVRQLWGHDDGGRFGTEGRYASALVRGTTWLVQDRCDGTLVRVARGAVLVRDRVRKVSVLVRAGHSLLVRAPR